MARKWNPMRIAQAARRIMLVDFILDGADGRRVAGHCRGGDVEFNADVPRQSLTNKALVFVVVADPRTKGNLRELESQEHNSLG